MGATNLKAAARQAQAVVVALVALVAVVPSLGQSVQSPKDLGKRTLLVSIPDRKLAVIEAGAVIATFPIAVGAVSSPSPTGEFQIVNRVQNPTYYHSGKVIPTGKDNPLGTRWLGLSQKGYGIHGTNVPKSVGHAASHGCIRLRNHDAERLFTLVRVGDVVQIRGERDEQIAEIFGDGDEVAEVDSVQAAGQE
jgi:lipoprotein-anchoring transpeptidase ErfK/SrfK